MTKTKDWSRAPRSELLSTVTAAVDTAKGEALVTNGEDDHFVRLCDEALFPFLEAEIDKAEREERTNDGFAIGSWERPDAGGLVRRGEAAEFVRGYVEKFKEAPHCHVWHHFGCEREAVMEVYGLSFCEAHGEEAAAGALEEIYHDLERRVDTIGHSRLATVGRHVEHALRAAKDSIPGPGGKETDDTLLAAFPLDAKAREQVDDDTLLYVEDLKAGIRHYGKFSPYDAGLYHRTILCKLMRIAVEEDAHWLVEILEKEREVCSAQAAWALALEEEAGL